MTITISLPMLLTALGLAIVLTIHIIVVARWTARIQLLVEQNTLDIKGLKKSDGERGEAMVAIGRDLEAARDNIGHLLARRHDDPHPEGA